VLRALIQRHHCGPAHAQMHPFARTPEIDPPRPFCHSARILLSASDRSPRPPCSTPRAARRPRGHIQSPSAAPRVLILAVQVN
jgi:hypothetical protein